MRPNARRLPSPTLRSPIRPVPAVMLLLLAASSPVWCAPGDFASDPPIPKAHPLAELDLSFIANKGQLDEEVRFHVRAEDQMIWLSPGHLTLGRTLPGGVIEVLEMRFLNTQADVPMEGRDRLQGVANFYNGNDPDDWLEGVPTYGSVAQVGLYPGIDQLFLGSGGKLKSELRVAPGADPSVVRMQYSGAASMDLASNGDLLMTAASGVWRESAPVVFQDIEGHRVDIPASFKLLGEGEVGFDIGAYDTAYELVIDPTFHYSTYLGGQDSEAGLSIALDPSHQAHICGNTRSLDFPLVNEVQSANQGDLEFFAAKLNPTGTALVYSTYIGGSSRELGASIALDAQGNAYCVGWTASSNFPTTPGVFQPAYSGSPDDAAIFKLGPTGALLASTYLGGFGDDQPEGLALSDQGEVFVVTNTSSSTFPTTGISPAHSGIWDVAVTKLSSNLAGPLIYSRFVGGSAYEEGTDIAVDAQGNAYVVGRTQSSDYPIFPAGTVYDPVYDGADTAFLTKLDPTGASLVYSTFLDGISPRFEAPLKLAVDDTGIAYVSAPTEGGLGFPPTPGAYASAIAGDVDAVVMKVRADGTGLFFSTFLGGSDEDQPRDIQVDANGKVFVTGNTSSSDFPLQNAISGSLSGTQDGFIAQLSSTGQALLFSSYVGGSDSDSAFSVALGVRGPCLTGGTSSSDFPTLAPSTQPDPPFQASLAGASDAFVTCLDGPTPCPEVTILDQQPAGNCVIIADEGYPSSRAENFVLQTLDDMVLSRIQLNGAFLYSNAAPPFGSEIFDINVYEAAVMSPNLPQPTPVPGCSQAGLSPSSRVDTLNNLGLWDLFEFTFDLNSNCVLQAGQTYWLEIFESSNNSDFFAWECGLVDTANGIPGGAHALQSPGTSWISQNLDVAIKLFAEPLTCDSDPCLDPPPDMVLWIPFDETSGVTAVDLVAGNNGTHMAGALPTGGIVNQAIDLENGLVKVPPAPILNFGTDDFSIDFWIREPNYPPLGSVVAKYDPVSDQGFEVFWELCSGCPVEAQLFIQLNGTVYQPLGLGVPVGAPLPWTHVVITVDRSAQQIDLYVNGAPATPTPINLPITASVSNTEPLLIGDGVTVSEGFAGELDELELFDRRLTADEATALFEAGSVGKCKSSCYVPWDSKFCGNQQETVVTSQICNHSSTAKTYQVDFSPLPSIAGLTCHVPGPTVFTDLSNNPAPLTVAVPAQACVNVSFKVQRPAGTNSLSPPGCFQAEFTDQATGWTKEIPATVRVRPWCFSDPDVVPIRFDVLALPETEGLQVTFELENTTADPVDLELLIEAMPLEMTVPQTSVSLNGAPPGTPVTGSVSLEPGSTVELVADVTNVDIQPFTFQDIILSTRVVGEETFIPFFSRGLRAPAAIQVVIANQDFATTFENSSKAILVASNDFALNAALDLGSVTILSSPSNGQVTVPGGGVVLYQPDPGYLGLDSLRYQICDVNGSCDSADVEVRVQPRGPDIFQDGFESGDTSAWSGTTP